MKSLYITCLLALSVTFATAQKGTLYKANKLYDAKAYAEAIPKYIQVLKKDSTNLDALIRIADSYRLTNNADGALKYYGKLVQTGKAEPIQKYYYGQALMSKAQYDEAKEYMSEYTADERGKTFETSIVKMDKFLKDEDAYKISKAPFNSDANDFSPAFYKNSIVFTSARDRAQWINRKHTWTDKNYYYLYATEKEGSNYTAPKLFAKSIQTKYNDGPVYFTKDGRLAYFTRNNMQKNKGVKSSDGIVKLKLYEATVSSNGDGYESVKEMPFNSNEYNCAHPVVSLDGSKLYFSSDMPGGSGGMDIWLSSKQTDGNWGSPVNLGSTINTKGNEVFPYITDDNTLYFSSNGLEGIGGLDIYETKLKDGKPTKVYNVGAPLNSSADDFGLAINADGKTGYFSSNRGDLNLNDDIYEFTQLRPIKKGLILKGITKDKTTKEIIPEALVKLKGSDGTDKEVKSNDKGEFEFDIEPNNDYGLNGVKEKYIEDNKIVSTEGLADNVTEITQDLFLEKDPGLQLLALVVDAKTKQPLEGVTMKLLDKVSGKVVDVLTPSTGDYKTPLTDKKIGDKLNYVISLSKPGYLSKEVPFVYDIKKPGIITTQNELGKIEVGMDIGKLININPIYFDLSKWNIRPDAAVELDKIVKVMKEYPNMVIELGSHTDCRASQAFNRSLSDKRAKSSATYIITKGGIQKDRIYGKGYGESKLVNGCACEGTVKSTCTEEEHQQNRRTEFIIVKLN